MGLSSSSHFAAGSRQVRNRISQEGEEGQGRLLGQVLRRLYPPTCVLCGAAGLEPLGHALPVPGVAGRGPPVCDGLDLCRACLAGLPRYLHGCSRCGVPLPAETPAGPCGQCQRRPPPYASCHAAFLYTEPLPTLVGGAKFRGRMNLIRLLGQCLALSLREHKVAMPDLIVPVPLHAKRLRQRGYNQALELARVLGRELGVPWDAHSCSRILHTKPQTALERKERRRNVRGAFRVRGPLGVERVAVLDDVVTTGSTVSELSRVLLQAGVEQVDVWAVARTP